MFGFRLSSWEIFPAFRRAAVCSYRRSAALATPFSPPEAGLSRHAHADGRPGCRIELGCWYGCARPKLWQSGQLMSFLSLIPLFRLTTCALRCATGHQLYVQVSNWAAYIEGLMHPPAAACLSQLAMDVMLSLPLLCTPSLSSIQSGLTWPTNGGVWVHTFEDHYMHAIRLTCSGR